MARRTAPRLTMLVFVLQPIAFGSWLPRIPDVQQVLGLGPTSLALVLLGLPAGTLLTLPFAGPLVGPPLTGLVGQYVDLRFGIAALLPILVVSHSLSGRLTHSAAAPNVLARGEA